MSVGTILYARKEADEVRGVASPIGSVVEDADLRLTLTPGRWALEIHCVVVVHPTLNYDPRFQFVSVPAFSEGWWANQTRMNAVGTIALTNRIDRFVDGNINVAQQRELDMMGSIVVTSAGDLVFGWGAWAATASATLTMKKGARLLAVQQA